MNSPSLRPEQLSPTLTPMALSLDDSTNSAANNIQHLLASPTRLSLDGGSSGTNSSAGGSAGNPLIYRTSLSKLSELSRRGRSKQRSNSETLRSASPIRLQFLNNAPKMLKPEYVSQQPSGMPLLSALIGNATTVSQSNNRLGIRETLEMLHKGISGDSRPQQQMHTPRLQQGDQFQLRCDRDNNYNNNSNDNHTGENNNNNNNNSNNNNNNNDKLRDQRGMAATEATPAFTADLDETLKRKPNSQHENLGTRMASNSSVASSTVTVNYNDLSKEMELDMLPTDKNGFVELMDGKSNRCSLISSSSTDFDPDWYNHSQSHSSEETAKLDYRIRQLELEIDELKLQNEKLIRSITTGRTVEDKFMLDALKEIRFSKQKAQRSMERKVKQLERKVENYRKVLRALADGGPLQQLPSHQLPYGQSSSCLESPGRQNYRKRIARISSLELRKIEENSDSSGPSPPNSSEDEDEQVTGNESGDQFLINETITVQDENDLSSNCIRRIGGLQLNIQLEMQRNSNRN